MGTNHAHLEVLLIIDTSFASEKLCKKDDSPQESHLTEKEQLTEACWNGLLQTMLPETFWQTANGSNLYLWQITEAASFLELDLGDVPAPIDRYFSITPHSFLSTLLHN